MDRDALDAALDEAFATTAQGLSAWPDPRAGWEPGRAPPQEWYSRVLDPGRYRLLGARWAAWVTVLVDAGLAQPADGSAARWQDLLPVVVTGTDRLVPTAPGALPLVVVHTQIEDVSDAGLVVGVGDPAWTVACIPCCGCDACDDGSEPLLEQLDDTVWGVVSGAFRLVRDGDRRVMTVGASGDGRWSAEGPFAQGEPDRWLADPRGRTLVEGAAWDAL
ncbi:hypothetical protein GCM10009867_24940 [Pedococcus aerophilus]|uniref:Uncharacterized protein n=1 Tax=Pedococcus aerophilus TaxID=436356 RepID=A0ABN3URB9_9MICO